MLIDCRASAPLSIAIPLSLAEAVFAAQVTGRAALRRRTLGRDAGIYLAHIAFSQSVPSLARAYARSPSTVRRACARIEDLREAPAMDRALACLEGAAGAFLRCLGEGQS
jgi:hypothetical protein